MENVAYYVIAIFILIAVPVIIIVGKKGQRLADQDIKRNINYRKKKKK